MAKAAVGRRRPKAGDWGAERAHLARAVQGPTDSTCRPAARIAGSPKFGLLTEETAGRKLAESAELLLGGGAGGFTEMATGAAGYRSGMARAVILGKAAAALSKNNNCGWNFLERVGKLQ